MEIQKLNPKKQWEQPQVKLILIELNTGSNLTEGADGGTIVHGS